MRSENSGHFVPEDSAQFSLSRDCQSSHLLLFPWKRALCLLFVWKQLERIFSALSQTLAFAEAVWCKSSVVTPWFVALCEKAA